MWFLSLLIDPSGVTVLTVDKRQPRIEILKIEAKDNEINKFNFTNKNSS